MTDFILCLSGALLLELEIQRHRDTMPLPILAVSTQQTQPQTNLSNPMATARFDGLQRPSLGVLPPFLLGLFPYSVPSDTFKVADHLLAPLLPQPATQTHTLNSLSSDFSDAMTLGSSSSVEILTYKSWACLSVP